MMDCFILDQHTVDEIVMMDCFILDQHTVAELGFYIAMLLKQKSKDRHVVPLRHSIHTQSQAVFAFSLMLCL